eukprot:TRINITY_DN27302_c0_g1_i1.p1 TRINITY_DN27302_c0_g1~~TRINITY_DN27302_c0_g1_i1.p1  ORF type:complete len:118 (-),score=16.24 TRINITY_DN27302_c0_g1_i1:217-570(-)
MVMKQEKNLRVFIALCILLFALSRFAVFAEAKTADRNLKTKIFSSKEMKRRNRISSSTVVAILAGGGLSMLGFLVMGYEAMETLTRFNTFLRFLDECEFAQISAVSRSRIRIHSSLM